MDPQMQMLQNPQVQQMLTALMQQGGGVSPSNQQQASLGNTPVGVGMLNQAPPMAPPPASPY